MPKRKAPEPIAADEEAGLAPLLVVPVPAGDPAPDSAVLPIAWSGEELPEAGLVFADENGGHTTITHVVTFEQASLPGRWKLEWSEDETCVAVSVDDPRREPEDPLRRVLVKGRAPCTLR